MPFMVGREPIRRTLKYLDAGKLILKDRIKIFSVNYNTSKDHHAGARDFVFWHLSQIQHKNPDVHVVTYLNMTPSPFIRCFTEKGESILVDLEGKNKEEILEHTMKVLGKSPELLAKEEKAREKKENPANFGYLCDKHCMCEFFGQVPCPGIVPLPFRMRGKKIREALEEED